MISMRVTVHYLTQIKRAAKRGSETLDLAGPVALVDFLRLLPQHHGPDFRALLLDAAGQPRRSLLFFVGDDHAELSRPLCDGDVVTILAPMAGGSCQKCW
jgi:molybdopterin converting factor small subunit